MTILDTLAMAHDLRNAGFSEQQANALVDAVRVAAGIPDISELATTDQLLAAKTELKAEMLATKVELQATKAELQAEIANAKNDILKWVFAMIVGALLINIGVMISLVQFLPHK